MDAFRAIDLNWTISYGGPGIANETLSLYAYRMGFSWWSIGEASALGFFMLFVTYTILLIIYRMYYGKAEVAGVVR
jgi:multiple sugar transport system permease protein